jgi:hypothetical protein
MDQQRYGRAPQRQYLTEWLMANGAEALAWQARPQCRIGNYRCACSSANRR